MHRLCHQSQNVYHRVFPLLEINSILSLLKSQCVLIRTKSLLHNGCKWEHSPRYTEKSLWLFRHRIFVSVLNVSDVPPCGIVGFSEVEILVRFNTLWPSKGYVTFHGIQVSAGIYCIIGIRAVLLGLGGMWRVWLPRHSRVTCSQACPARSYRERRSWLSLRIVLGEYRCKKLV